MSNLTKTIKNPFSALSNDEHDNIVYPELSDVVLNANSDSDIVLNAKTDTGTGTDTDTDTDTDISKPIISKPTSKTITSKPMSWSSVVSAAANPGVISTGEPDVYEPSSAVHNVKAPITDDNVSDDNAGWQQAKSKKKGNNNQSYGNQSYGNQSYGNQSYNNQYNKNSKQFGRNRDSHYKKPNTYNSRDGSDNSNKSASNEFTDNSESNVPKRIMDIPINNGTNNTSFSYNKSNNSESNSGQEYTERSYAKPISSFTKLEAYKQNRSGNPSNNSSTNSSAQVVDDSQIAKKSFTAKTAPRKTTIDLPAYYGVRSGKDPFEIPQREYEWVKRVGGLEKSETIDHMFKGTLACAISFFDNYMVKNEFFKDKISTDDAKKDELIELVCMQTAAILFHRLIKSDSSDIVKTILTNLPLYRTVSGNPTERSNSSTSAGSIAYMRVRRNFINDLRISQGKTATKCTNQEKQAAADRVTSTEKKWLNYILQSVWNGNNPVHDCLYYGANQSLEFLLLNYIQHSMLHQLNHMMLIPNIQNESHLTIIENGIKANENNGTLNIIRRKQFNDCAHLYNSTIKSLYAQINKLVDDEAGEILSQSAISDLVDKSMSKNDAKNDAKNDTKNDANTEDCNEASDLIDASLTDENMLASESDTEADGDNANICSLIYNGDVEGMSKHIERCAKKNQHKIIEKTFELWKSTAEADHTGALNDYISDVEFLCAEFLKKSSVITESS